MQIFDKNKIVACNFFLQMQISPVIKVQNQREDEKEDAKFA